MLPLMELEGVIAHELAHVKRGDNGVSCVAITLAPMLGGERMLRRCVGENREYRADVVGCLGRALPERLLGALFAVKAAPAPGGIRSSLAVPLRATRWVWIDPSVGHRDDPWSRGPGCHVGEGRRTERVVRRRARPASLTGDMA